jgi:hypothetical protein
VAMNVIYFNRNREIGEVVGVCSPGAREAGGVWVN